MTKPVTYRDKRCCYIFSPPEKNPKPIAPQSPSWLWGFFSKVQGIWQGVEAVNPWNRFMQDDNEKGLADADLHTSPTIQKWILAYLKYQGLKYQDLAHGLISDIVDILGRQTDLGTCNCHSLDPMSFYRWE